MKFALFLIPYNLTFLASKLCDNDAAVEQKTFWNLNKMGLGCRFHSQNIPSPHYRV